MLDVFLTLNSVSDIVEPLKIDQSLQTVALGEAFDESRAMLEDTAHKIVGHADIQNAVWAIGQNVNIASCHTDRLQDVDGRDKPGHDELKEFV